jgi:putative addiction module component (TIGR02574 family)
MPNVDFHHLSARERLDLIGDLLDSLDEGDIPLPADQRTELDRRAATFEADRAHALPWSEVRRALRPDRP